MILRGRGGLRPRPLVGKAAWVSRADRHPEQAVRWASCHSHTGHRVIPLYDCGYSVGSRQSTHSAYGGPSARGGFVASRMVQ